MKRSITETEKAIIKAAYSLQRSWIRNYHQGFLLYGTPEYNLWLSVKYDKSAKRRGKHVG